MVVFFLSARAAEACRCAAPRPLAESFESADVVFVGTTSFAFPADSSLAPQLRATAFEVEEVFKYDRRLRSGDRLVLRRGNSDCESVSFSPGGRYLMFAWSAADGSIGTSWCVGNRAVTDAPDAVAEVRAIADRWTPPPGTQTSEYPVEPTFVAYLPRSRATPLERSEPASAVVVNEISGDTVWGGVLLLLLGVLSYGYWTGRRARAG